MERGVHAGGRASAGSKQQARKGMSTPALVNRVLRCAPRAGGWLQDRWRGVWRWSFRSERVPGAVRGVRAGRATPRRALLTRRRWRRTVLESGWPALRRAARTASASGGGVLDRTQSRERIPRPRARGMVRTAGHQHWPGSRRAMKPRTGAGHGVRHSSAATGGGSGAQGGRRITVGEAPPVGVVAGSGRLAHQALGAQQPMHGRVREMHAVGEVAAGYGATDHLPYRPGWLLGLDRDQQFGDLRRQPARTTTIGARPGIQRIEAAAPVVQQPVAHSLGGHAGCAACPEWCTAARPWHAAFLRSLACRVANGSGRRSSRSGTAPPRGATARRRHSWGGRPAPARVASHGSVSERSDTNNRIAVQGCTPAIKQWSRPSRGHLALPALAPFPVNLSAGSI